ncbi:MAG: chemotaxis protein CheC [Coriobacteriia bacterium]|nr:chemotaxis protein CheC [Coriobacteriia bacterium]
MRIEQLNEMQLDALRETGSIGAGHAATALSQLVGHGIEIDVPILEIMEIGDVPELFGGPETLVAAAYMRLLGDIGGSMLFVAPRSSSLALVDLMRARPVGTAKSFGAEEEALVTHVASILVSAYVASIGRLADLSLLPARPAFALDMAGALLEAVTSEAGMQASRAVLLRTRFFDSEVAVDAYLFFLPDATGLEVLLGRLGVA